MSRMFWNESKARWEPHPDCTCGAGTDWTERGINRPCVCRFLNPLDANGRPISYPVMEGLRETHGGEKS